MDGLEINLMFENVFANKNVIITGNTGFKGSWLTAWLLKLGANVFGISKDVPTDPSMFEILSLENKIKHHNIDIRDLEKTKEVFELARPDFLFHLAAQPLVSVSYHDPVETISSNVLGTAHILECLRSLKKECAAVIITSDKCYDNVEWEWGYRETDRLGGKDIYSGSKGAAELVIKSFFHSFFSHSDSKVNIASTRAGNVIGGGDWARDRIVPDCVRSWSENQLVDIRSPESTRPWQHVLEPLSGYLVLGQCLATGHQANGDSYNFGPPTHHNYSVRKLIDEMGKHWGKVRWNDVSNSGSYMHEAGLLKLNCDKALANLNWSPTLHFQETVKMTIEWYQTYYQSAPGLMFDMTNTQIDEYVALAKKQGASWIK